MKTSTRSKGQAYSIIAILIIIPIVLFMTGFLYTKQGIYINRGEKILSDQMSQIAKNVEDDFVRAVQTSGRRAVLSAVNEIILTGQPIDNATLRLHELMTNGSLYGNVSVIMFNNTFEDWRIKILSTINEFNANVSYSNVSIRNYDGFNILVSTLLEINISHPFSQSRISRMFVKNVSVSVEGFEDPLYLLNSGGNMEKQILKYPYSSYAINIFPDNGFEYGNCTGEVIFDEVGGTGNILVVVDASGVGSPGGYGGIVSETSDAPASGCYSAGNTDAINVINATILNQNYSTLYLDEATGVWLLPISSGLQYYNMFSFSDGDIQKTGPDFLMRLEGRLNTTKNGLESFVTDGLGIQSKPSQSRVDYKYFSDSTITGSHVRGTPSWFKIDSVNAGRYNVSNLLEA